MMTEDEIARSVMQAEDMVIEAGRLSTPYEKAIEYAQELGAQHGRNAASWLDIDETNAARILAGITDGDPAILDALPSPDLSGQWAGSLTGPALVADAWDSAGLDIGDDGTPLGVDMDAFSDICDAYEVAFSEHAQYAVEDRCRYHLPAIDPAFDAAYDGESMMRYIESRTISD